MSDIELLRSQVERFKRMTPAEQAAFSRMDGGEMQRFVDDVEAQQSAGRKYDPFDTSEWSTADGRRGWRTIDDNHFAAMREYYTRGQREVRTVVVHDVVVRNVVQLPTMLALMPGPRPFGELTSGC